MIDQLLSFDEHLNEERDEIIDIQGKFGCVQELLQANYTMLLKGFYVTIGLAGELEGLMKKFYAGVGTYKDYYHLRKIMQDLSSRLQQIEYSIQFEYEKREREERRRKKNLWNDQQPEVR